MKSISISLLFICCALSVFAQEKYLSAKSSDYSVFLNSDFEVNNSWRFKKASEIKTTPENLSSMAYNAVNWMPATVPGTVLSNLVANKIYPDPYFGDNNSKDTFLFRECQRRAKGTTACYCR